MPAPAYQVRHIGLAEGLDNMRVFSILQDRNDVMWIATKNGVNRYNGCVMKAYRLSSDRVYSNAAGRIFSLRQDGDTLYAYDNKGNIYRYSSAWDHFEHVVSLSKWFRGYLKLNDLYIDRHHRLWLATRDGLYCYDHGHVSLAGPTQEVNVITADDHGRLFIATASAVLAQFGKRWKTLSGLEGMEAQSLYFDAPAQRLWVGSLVQGIRVYDLKTHRVDVVSHPWDKRRCSWVSTEKASTLLTVGNYRADCCSMCQTIRATHWAVTVSTPSSWTANTTFGWAATRVAWTWPCHVGRDISCSDMSTRTATH